MYCGNCQKEFSEDLRCCPYCGVIVDSDKKENDGEALNYLSNAQIELTRKVTPDNINAFPRSQIIETINTIIQIFQHTDTLLLAIENIKSERTQFEKKAKSDGTHMRPYGKKCIPVVFIICLIVGVTSGDFALIIPTAILMWIFAVVLIGKIFDLSLFEYVETPEIKKFLETKREQNEIKMQKAQSVLQSHVDSYEYKWANNILPDEYSSIQTLNMMKSYIESRRADNIKEALNVYIQDCHMSKMESMQERITIANEKSAAVAKEIAKNTKSSARTAKINAAINYGIYKNTKK